MGVNIGNDGRKLFKDWGVQVRGLVELSYLAREVDDELEKKRAFLRLDYVVERYTGRTLLKGPVRLSNWELWLKEEQLECESSRGF